MWRYLQNIEEISFSESLSPWTLLWAHRTGLGAGKVECPGWGRMLDLPLPQLMSLRFLIACWLESLHGLKLMLACIKNYTDYMNRHTSFPQLKLK